MNILDAIQSIAKFTPKFHALNETGKVQITLAPDNKGGDRRIIIALELKDRVQGE